MDSLVDTHHPSSGKMLALKTAVMRCDAVCQSSEAGEKRGDRQRRDTGARV